MRESYINASMYGTNGGEENIFKRTSSLFVREPERSQGQGSHYIVDLVGKGGKQLVSDVCDNHGIPIIDLSEHQNGDNIRDLVKWVLEKTPPRCAYIVDTRNNIFMQKVRTRIMNIHCDLNYRRVVFCLADHETISGNCIQVPGSIDDRLAVLIYHIPDCIQRQTGSLECFRPLAEAMVDYSLFWPINWQKVRVDGTPEEFISTAMYQIIRRVSTDDPAIAFEYPSFEVEWRSLLARRLHDILPKPPDSLCPTIHRVIPIGVSASDAMQAMTMAIPEDVKEPYTITTHSSAIDNQCGRIVIAQPMRYTVVNVNCMIDPKILVDVCRDLRIAHRDVVSKMHSVSMMLAKTQEQNHMQLSHMEEQHKEQALQMEQRYEDKLSVMEANILHAVMGNGDNSEKLPEVRPTKCGNNFVLRSLRNDFILERHHDDALNVSKMYVYAE
jgi:hypothetical protein